MPVSTESRIVVLGGTSGVGLAIAKAAAVAGASVTVASRNPASVESALAELPTGWAGRAVDASSTEGTGGVLPVLRGLRPLRLHRGSAPRPHPARRLHRGGGPGLLRTAAGARALAVELAPIRVNVVAPGVVRSPLWSEIPEADREAMYDSVGSSVPLGRVAEVEDVARAYLQLMDQDYATGTVSVINGGMILV